jgi:hypothetical protein
MTNCSIHVIPIGDTDIHAAQGTCWCHPLHRDGVYTHNAKDCREASERHTGEQSSEGWVLVREMVEVGGIAPPSYV